MKLKVLICLTCFFLFLASCKDDHSYSVPTTYNFENVSYKGQLDRLGMLSELKSYLSTAEDGISSLDAGRLAAMYANANDAVSQWDGTYDQSKQLKSKTYPNEQAVFDAILNAAATDSQNNGVASEGTPGVLTSLDGTKNYFVNAKGVEYAQIVEKGLMGACLFYQATGVYLESGKMDVDNDMVILGEGTEMEHHWDESFGYFGVPKDFPTNTEDVVFWGKYCNSRNELIQSNNTIMDAYIAGRAAISNNDLDTRDLKINEIQVAYDQVAASTALHYINSAETNYNDMAKRAHALSEAVAFTYSIQFNPDASASLSEIQSVLNHLGGSTEFLEMDFYNVSIDNLIDAKNQLANIYNWESIKNEF